MGRTQALACIFLLLLLVAKHEVQADTSCDRQCPGLCYKKGKSVFQCYLYCIKHCDSGHDGVRLTKKEEKQLQSDSEAMVREIEEKLIHTPSHELEGPDADKLKEFLRKRPQDFKGQGSEKKERGKKVRGRKEKEGKKRIQGSKEKSKEH